MNIKKYFVVLLFLSCLNFNVFADEETESIDQENNNSLIKKISDINMRSFPWKEEGWSCHTMVEWIQKFVKFTLNPTPSKKRGDTFKFFEKAEEHSNNILNLDFDNSATWQDLDLFCGKGESPKFVANVLDETVTEMGTVSFYSLLAQTTTDTKLLQDRQRLICLLKDEDLLAQNLQNSLEKIKTAENILFNFWDEYDTFKHLIKEIKFPDCLNVLNKSENILLARGALHYADILMGFGLKSATSLALISYGILNATNLIDVPERLKKWSDDHFTMGTGATAGYLAGFIWKSDNKIIHSILPIILGIYCATTLKKNFDHIHGSILFQYYLHMFTNHLAQATQSMKNIYESIKTYDEFSDFEEFKALKVFYEKEVDADKNLQDLLNTLKAPTFNGRNVLVSHHGVIFKVYSLMNELKEKFEQALLAVARIDAYFSISKLIKEQERKNINFCFPEYVKSDKPFIKIDNFWHPLVDEEKVVTNSITLGIDDFKPNVVLTGPNEGGKSTVLKAISTSLILAQTIGIAPAQSMSFTPFKSISTYLNITDDIGSGNSLFKSEVLRAQELIERITNFQPDEFNFCVFDEIFNGTSPLEGSSAAYGVTKHLASLQNSICMISTHFPVLTKLEKDTDTFTN